MGFFTWIRTAVRQAVIGGLQDAADELAKDGGALVVRVELPAIGDKDEKKGAKAK
jgi:hypothetical protein